MSARRWLAVAAYIPLIAALGFLAALCLLLLLRREPAGFYAVPYGLGATLLALRASRLQKGGEEGAEEPPALETGLAVAADLLLAAVVAGKFL